MVVRVHRRVGAAGGAQELIRPVREYLVTVHVVARARAGLVRVHHELVPVRAAEHLVRRPDDRVGQRRLEPAGLLVGERCGALDPEHRVHERRHRPEAADGEVLHGAEGLDAVERVRGDGLLAERVLLDAGGHGNWSVSGER